MALIGILIFAGGTAVAVRQFNELSENIEYITDNAPNIRCEDRKESGPVAKKKNPQARRVKDPETIFEEAAYLVKIRIFKKIVIPGTEQVIYQDTRGFGSGFITDDKKICKKSGYCVVTAFHVVDDSSMTYFAEAKDGSKAQALELTHSSTNYDFSVLRFIDIKHVPKKVAVIGRSSSLKPGARIYAMGSNLFGDFWFSPSGHLYASVKAANPALRKKTCRFRTGPS